MLLMLLMKAKKLMILFSIIILTTMIPILMSNYYRSSNSSTLSATATAAIPDRDDDERSRCSVHTFAAADVVEVTIGYSTHSFGRRRMHINMAYTNPLKYDKGDIDDRGSCSFVPVVHIRMHIHLFVLIVIAVVTR